MGRKIRLTALVGISVLMLALLIGGLYGYFNDTETSNGNWFTAGTLNLVSVISGNEAHGHVTVNEQADGLNDNVTFGRVAPGDSGSITWTLTNQGTVDGLLSLDNTTTVVNFAENGSNERPLLSATTAVTTVTWTSTCTAGSAATAHTLPMAAAVPSYRCRICRPLC